MRNIRKKTYYFITGRNQTYKLLTVLVLSCSVISCESVKTFTSKPYLLDVTPPPGPPIYQTAYVDGCNAGIYENSNNILAMGKGLYKHPVYNKTSNLYRKLWRSAMTYCYLWWPKLHRNNASFFSHGFKLKTKGIFGSQKETYLSSAPPGPRNFRIGWKDGCTTGKGATGGTKYKMAHGFKKDPRYIEGDKFNKEYEKGWETAFWYCQRTYDIYESPARRALM